MPVKVVITMVNDIGTEINPQACRTLVISRITNTHIQRKYERNVDEINKYEVLVKNTPDGPVKDRVEINHIFGDDLYTLVHEAIEALGGVGGPRTGMRR